MRSLVIIILFLSITFNVVAWNDHAHMVSAAIAWDKLDDTQKLKVTSLLEQHPEYTNEWKGAYQNHKELLPLGKFLMMKASVWPDEIKKKSNLNYVYNRPEWHYIVQKLYFNKPIDENNPEVKKAKNEEDIVWAINHCLASIDNKELSKPLKAVYFSWLIHLTADIHQPLHTCALFDDDKLKKGDRGGNLIYIATSSDTTDLQGYWDELLGFSKDTRKVLQQGFIYRKKIPFMPEYIEEMNPVNWAKASFLVAKNTAYLNGKLKYATNRKDHIPKVTETYEKASLEIAIERITIAGYRLANQVTIFLTSF